MQTIIDIAGSYQAGIDLAAVKNEGHSGVVCKATEGTTYEAPLFSSWIDWARALGLIPGAYHYLRAGNGAAQADFFWSKVAAKGGPLGWIIQLDCEADAEWITVVQWVQRWNELSGRYPFAMYTGDWWWDTDGRRWDGASLTPYLWACPNDGYPGTLPGQDSPDWHANYGGWVDLAVMQYTNHGNAGAIAGNVDINAIRDPAVLAALTRGAFPAPGPAPSPEPTPSPSTGGPDMTPQEWKDTPLNGVDNGQAVRTADAMGRIYNWSRSALEGANAANATAAAARDAAGGAQAQAQAAHDAATAAHASADGARDAATQALAGVQALGGTLTAILEAIHQLPAPAPATGGGEPCPPCPPAEVDVKVLINEQLAAEGKAQVG